MYKALGAALRKFHGRRASYRVVEDGDPKGFQSNKGIQAKKEQKIRSWKLSPRSPVLMPLDYSLWNEIERRVLAKKGPANESMQAYKKRLNLTAKKLPRGQVKHTASAASTPRYGGLGHQLRWGRRRPCPRIAELVTIFHTALE